MYQTPETAFIRKEQLCGPCADLWFSRCLQSHVAPTAVQFNLVLTYVGVVLDEWIEF